MPRKSPDITVQEVAGDRFSDLRAAQKNAVSSVVPGLVGTMRALLASGRLVVVDGVIVPNPEWSAA